MLKRPKVSVCVVTYNHEAYIEKCLQSLLDQQTTFEFEIIVGEDCSTDKTRSIVEIFAQKYPKKVKAIFHKKNVGAAVNYKSIHNLAQGKYIAHLDGDDYALPGKLQAQADHLDKHHDCVVVWHRMKILDPQSGKLSSDQINTGAFSLNGITQSDVLELGSVACHSSKMYRASARPGIYPTSDFLDYYVDVENLSYGSGHYLEDFLGVYRKGVGFSSIPHQAKILKMHHLASFSKTHYKFRKNISAHALRIFISDLVRLRKTLPNSLVLVARTFHPLGVIRFFASRKIMKKLTSRV